MKGTVGVIGLGLMGGAMARNLCTAGFKVVGFDTDAAIARAAAADNIETVADAAAVAARAHDILLSLPSAAAVAATVQAIVAAGVGPRVLIETSTLDLTDKLRVGAALEAAGHIALDCPLSGTGAQAVTRDLVILASGDSASIARLDSVFLAIGRQVFDLGEFGHGTRMKLIANLLVAIHNVASAEAMVLAKRAGLDLRRVLEVIGAGAATSRIFELRAPLMAENRYEPPTMRLSTWQKDMAAIAGFAATLDFPAPLFSATAPLYEAALADGRGEQDTAAVCAVLEAMTRASSTAAIQQHHKPELAE